MASDWQPHPAMTRIQHARNAINKVKKGDYPILDTLPRKAARWRRQAGVLFVLFAILLVCWAGIKDRGADYKSVYRLEIGSAKTLAAKAFCNRVDVFESAINLAVSTNLSDIPGGKYRETQDYFGLDRMRWQWHSFQTQFTLKNPGIYQGLTAQLMWLYGGCADSSIDSKVEGGRISRITKIDGYHSLLTRFQGLKFHQGAIFTTKRNIRPLQDVELPFRFCKLVLHRLPLIAGGPPQGACENCYEERKDILSVETIPKGAPKTHWLGYLVLAIACVVGFAGIVFLTSASSWAMLGIALIVIFLPLLFFALNLIYFGTVWRR